MVESNEPTPSAVVIVMGVSGCGKSSIGRALASRLSAPFLEADDLHPERNIRKMSSGVALTDEDRAPWLNEVNSQVRSILSEQKSCVVACSALKKIYRDQLRETHPETRFVYLQGSKKLIEERMKKREDHFMPLGLLDSQFDTLESPVTETGVVTVPINDSIEGTAVEAHRLLVAMSTDALNPD